MILEAQDRFVLVNSKFLPTMHNLECPLHFSEEEEHKHQFQILGNRELYFASCPQKSHYMTRVPQ